MGLNYKGFENNLFKVFVKYPFGIQYLFKFDNGYGASVIHCYGSYHTINEPWELAVIKFDSSDHFEIDYDTDITDDVIGYLYDVRNLLKRISELDNH